MTEQEINRIKDENLHRHKQINKPYDPLTGEGCEGRRVCLKIEDAPFSLFYLPEQMMREKICQKLVRQGSLKKLFEKEGEKLTEDAYSEFWIKFAELRYQYDFEYFAMACITIRDKITGQDIPFRLNRGQRKLLRHLEKIRLGGSPIRLILLKARQWGGSTLIQMYMFWIQLIHKKNWNSVICAHLKDASITIRSMFERAVSNMIPIDGVSYTIKNFNNTQNIKEVFDRGALITVGTAIEPDSVRSQDAKMAHFSEIAFYPNTDKNRTEDLITSIVGSIPREELTMVAFESTANGVGDFFNSEWEKACKGETAYEPVFVEWFLIPIYSEPFDGTFYNHQGKKQKGKPEQFISTMDDYEKNLFRNHSECTLENINWYRGKLSEMPGRAKMKQEYPSDDFEAFQDSGLPAFRSSDVEAMRADCIPPLAIGDIISECSPALAKLYPNRRKEIIKGLTFREDKEALEDITSSSRQRRAIKERNKLKIWKHPDCDISIKDRYIVVYDPSKGVTDKADFGVIAVFDRYPMTIGEAPEIVAEWRGHEDKDIVIWIAVQIAAFYNKALLVVESNTYESEAQEDDSEFIFDTIAGYYDNLYSRTPADKIQEGIPLKYGFHTNRSTKTMIIANFVAILREKGYRERNAEALNEARFYEQKKNGSYGAKEGKHDDILMTRMIGCYICYELPFPKPIEANATYKAKKPLGLSSF